MINYRNRILFRSLVGIGMMVLLVLIIGAANLGVSRISLGQTWAIIASRIPVLNQWVSLDTIPSTAQIIILNLRLPRILLAGLLGAGLAVAGSAFQGIFKNPMADPFVLGISSGAALGASVAMVWGAGLNVLGFGLITLAAFSGGITTVLLVYNIARVGNKVSNNTLLLAGIAINFLLSALVSLLMIFKRDQIERIVMWTMGSVATANWTDVGLTFPVVMLSIGVIWAFARDLNVLLLGEENARTLGIEVEKVKKAILTVGTLMVAVLVSVSGVIGFVGLIVPHMMRLLWGADHRVVIPFTALGGAILLIGCDTLARTIVTPNEIPLGIVTAILGVPFFLYLVANARKKVV